MSHKILIVENDPPSASRSVRALRTAGFRVVAPASATTALATFDRVRPDLVLVGTSLPDNGGVTLCRDIKKTSHGSRTPVALLLDHVEIDLPPMAELGWDRLIENATGDDELVAICRELIETRGRPSANAATTESGEAGRPDGEQKSLEDVIDEVLTFEHEQSVAHVQRAATQPVGTSSNTTAPAIPKPVAAPERAVAVAAPARAPQAERPRFQTAALVTPKPEASEASEAPCDEPTPQHSPPPARRWWIAAAVGLGAVAIATAAWVGLSGGGSPSPVSTATPSVAPPAAPVPSPLQITAPLAMPASPEDPLQPGTGTVAASVAPLAIEPAPKIVEPEPVAAVKQPEPEPKIVEPEPVAAVKQPEPEPKIVEPEPVAAVKQPEPEPETVEPEPVAAVKQPEPEPEIVEPEPVAAVKQPEPEPETVEPEPVAAVKQPEPEPEIVEPEPVAAVKQPEPEPEIVEPEPVALVEPVLLQRVEPTLSAKALKSNRGASVVLRLLINEQGSVIRVVVDQGVPGSELEAATINAVLRWKYRPATRGGVPTQQWTEARFTFE